MPRWLLWRTGAKSEMPVKRASLCRPYPPKLFGPFLARIPALTCSLRCMTELSTAALISGVQDRSAGRLDALVEFGSKLSFPMSTPGKYLLHLQPSAQRVRYGVKRPECGDEQISRLGSATCAWTGAVSKKQDTSGSCESFSGFESGLDIAACRS